MNVRYAFLPALLGTLTACRGAGIFGTEAASSNGHTHRNADRAAGTERGPVRVTFVAGTRRSEENEALLGDLRSSFEKFLR